MSDIHPLPHRRRLWTVFVAPGLFLAAAAAWSVFWFYAASQVDTRFEGWRAREARSGRTYECANRSVAGFPFRLEVRCSDPVIALKSQSANAPAALTARMKEILVVAQIYDPRLIIAEFKGPVTIERDDGKPFATVNWSSARASVAGLPILPQRISLVVDEAAIDRTDGVVAVPMLRAKHLELHNRLAQGSVTDNPVIEIAWLINAGTLPDTHPLLATPFEADVRARLSGLKNFAPKPWPERFREIAAANGRIEITQSRFAQNEALAVTAGSLGLTQNGNLDGELQATVVGLDRIITGLQLDKVLDAGVSQSAVDRVAPGISAESVNKTIGALDRMIPGLGNFARQNISAAATAGVNMLGKESTLDGKKARAFPVKFNDGVVSFGPLKVGRTPQLF